MLKKVLKWTGIILASLLLIMAGTYLAISLNIDHRINKQYKFSLNNSALPMDSAAIQRGKHLVAIKGCNDCHGNNMAGKVFINNSGLGLLAAVNLTKGKGGLPANFDTADWLMALEHGVGKNGKPLLLMPSYESTKLTPKDKLAIIAYCNSLPPVDNMLPASKLGPISKVMTFLGKMPLLSVEMIDHNAKPIPDLTDTVGGIALGKYLAVSCVGCHRADFKGGDPVAPGFPPVPNITSTGERSKWTKAQFMIALRTGKTPAGHQMKPENMPWTMTAQYTDKELLALYEFLNSLKG